MNKQSEEVINNQNEWEDNSDNVSEEVTAAEDQEPRFEDLFEESLKDLQEGELVKGTIVNIESDFVIVDIGYKSEGRINIHEFMEEDKTLKIKVGDVVDVLLEKYEDDGGNVVISKEKAARIKIWDDITAIYDNNGTIQGKVLSRVKGGLAVDVGIQAFLPGSQVDLKPVRNLDKLIGEVFDFKVLKYNKKRRNIVLSRRAILEKDMDKKREETISLLKEGSVVQGIVKNITDYGAFIDLGGIDGLLHITDISWGRVGHPSEAFGVGDEISVVVLSFDTEKQRVSLGVKQLNSDPWLKASEKYVEGAKVTGKVVSITDYGAFIELEQGVEGLIHISEMSWTKKVRHPSKLVSIGDTVEAIVLKMDFENKRISLGMKQIDPNPWDVIAEKYPVGTVIEGKIKNITDFGLFIGIDEGIDGLVHISDLSWTRRLKHPSDMFQKGDEVRAVVLNIDRENEKFSLGIKQIETDPWQDITIKYAVGTKVEGTVTNVTDFGVFVGLEEGIEGLVHISEVSKEKIQTAEDMFKIGDMISAVVINVSSDDRKIGLSIKRANEVAAKSDYKSYLNNKIEPTSSLGELLREGLEAKNQ